MDKTANERIVSSSLLAGLVLLAWLLYHHSPAFTQAYGLKGDYPVVALAAHRAAEFELLTGLYGRFSFSHPGPAAFYVYALFNYLFPELSYPYGPLSLAQLALNLLFVTLGAFALGKALNSIYPIGLSVAAFVWALPRLISYYFIDIWPPVTLVAPAFCFLSVVTAWVSGGRLYLSILVLSAGFLLSQHIGTLVLIGPVGLFVLARSMIRLIRSQSILVSRIDLVLSFLMVLLFALGPLCDLIQNGKRANFFRLVTFATSRGGDHSLAESVRYVLQFLEFELFSLPVFVYPLAAGVHLLMVRSRFEHRPLLLGLAVILCSMFGATRITGVQHLYLMYWLYGVSLFLAVFSLSVLLLALRNLVRGSFLTKSFDVGIALFVVLALPLSASRIDNPVHDNPDYQLVSNQILNHGISGVKLKPHGKRGWNRVANLAVELNRKGIPYCVPRGYASMLGKNRVCSIGGDQTTWIDLTVEKVRKGREDSQGSSGGTIIDGFEFKLGLDS